MRFAREKLDVQWHGKGSSVTVEMMVEVPAGALLLGRLQER